MNRAVKDQEKLPPQISLMALSQTSSGFFLFQIKYPTYQTKKPSLMACAQWMSRRWTTSIMKYIDYDCQDVWTSILTSETTSEENQNEKNIELKTKIVA
jgi:hypothetical protein